MNRTKMNMGNIVKREREMGTTVQCTASANTVYFLSINLVLGREIRGGF
jgi:hypothetical protein